MNDEEMDFEQADRLIKQRQIFKRQPKQAGTLASRVIGRYGVAAEQGIQDLEKAWEEAAGKEFKGTTQVGAKKNNRLEVICSNNMVMQRLAFKKIQIIQDLNRLYPTAKIKELTFRIGNVN
jgi:hypothetical protein